MALDRGVFLEALEGRVLGDPLEPLVELLDLPQRRAEDQARGAGLGGVVLQVGGGLEGRFGVLAVLVGHLHELAVPGLFVLEFRIGLELGVGRRQGLVNHMLGEGCASDQDDYEGDTARE